jgi:hypothetical protein
MPRRKRAETTEARGLDPWLRSRTALKTSEAAYNRNNLAHQKVVYEVGCYFFDALGVLGSACACGRQLRCAGNSLIAEPGADTGEAEHEATPEKPLEKATTGLKVHAAF